MIFLLLLRLLLGFFFYYYNDIIKFEFIKKNINNFIDILIFFLFLYFYFFNKDIIDVITFKFFFIITVIYMILIILNYIFINRLEFIINKINKNNREVIKKIFMKPIVFKLVYWVIWILPWNVVYYIYFWWMEYGWYLRVWINSTRDIILWKLFKWDSRDYFCRLNININFYKIKNMIYRILILLYLVRYSLFKNNVNMLSYLKQRIISFMYISLFYYYAIYELYLLNIYLFSVIFLIVILILYKLDWLIFKLEKKNELNFNELKKDEWMLIIYKLLLNPQEILTRELLQKEKTIWDVTLSNSLSLRILYKWMIYVNNNTKGYYDVNYNIGTRIHRVKYNVFLKNSIIWDLIPRTRYVIYALYNIQESKGVFEIVITKDIKKYYVNELKMDLSNLIKKNYNQHINSKVNNVDILKKLEEVIDEVHIPDIRIRTIKNVYLNYYEKTYNDGSLLSIIWLFRMYFANLNFTFFIPRNNEIFNNDYINFITLINFHKKFNYTYFLIQLIKNNSKLIDEKYLFKFIDKLQMNLEVEYIKENYMKIILGELKSEIGEYRGIKKYKERIKIMSYMMLNEEEEITWNDKLLEFSFNVEQYNMPLQFDIINKNIFFDIKKKFPTFRNIVLFDFFKSDLIFDVLMYDYKIKFTKDKLDDILNYLNKEDLKKLKIINYGFFEDQEDINNQMSQRFVLILFMWFHYRYNVYDLTNYNNMNEIRWYIRPHEEKEFEIHYNIKLYE